MVSSAYEYSLKCMLSIWSRDSMAETMGSSWRTSDAASSYDVDLDLELDGCLVVLHAIEHSHVLIG
jgi:hypothetical protein